MFAEAICPISPEIPNEIITQILVEARSLTRRMLALTSRENLKLVPLILREFAPKRFTRLGDPRKYSISKYQDILKKYVHARVYTILGETVPEYFLQDNRAVDVAPRSEVYLLAAIKSHLPVDPTIPVSSRMRNVATRQRNTLFFKSSRPKARPTLCAALLSGYSLNRHWSWYILKKVDMEYMIKYPKLVRAAYDITTNHYIFSEILWVHQESTIARDYQAFNEMLQITPYIPELSMFDVPNDATYKSWRDSRVFTRVNLHRIIGDRQICSDVAVKWFLDKYYSVFPEDAITQLANSKELAAGVRELGCEWA